MNNYNKKPDSRQKIKTLTYQEYRSCANKELAQRQKTLEAEKAKLGHDKTSWEDFAKLSLGGMHQAQASAIIELQNDHKLLQEQREIFESIICIEPSKLPETLNTVEKLLLKESPNHIYQRSGKLVRVTKICNSPSSKKSPIKRSPDTEIIKEIDPAFLTIHLTKIGKFVQFDGRSGKIRDIDCPERIARFFLAKATWETPVLTGIINAPTLRTDGSILDQPGYDSDSGLLFLSGDCIFEKIPDQATKDDALKARDRLLDLLKDFSFEDDVGVSVALAALLTALIRKSIATAPLFGFTAPKMSSGKSLLTNVIALIATGKNNKPISQAENDTEEKKRILAILLEGDPIICYDNIEKPFGNDALCVILTEREYKDRVLGISETRTVATNATFLVTGNNLVFTGDISTRALLCKLDPQTEHPEDRSFDRNLYTYIPEKRGQLVQACLTILRSYHVEGRPPQPIKPFGRFEEWSNWVRSAIVWLGMKDPCESRKDIENNDPERRQLTSLLYALHAIFGETPFKVKELKDSLAQDSNDERYEKLKEALSEFAPGHQGEINWRSLGAKLGKAKNRIEDGMRLEVAGSCQKTTLWRVKKMDR